MNEPLLTRPAGYAALCARLDFASGLPFSANWSAEPDFLEHLAGHALRARPRRIVECSSGLSTLVLARCCARNGTGAVTALENDPRCADRTRAALVHYGLQAWATVVDAPLDRQTFDGRECDWYRLPEDLPGGIDLLVIDGPPGFAQHMARFPALPALRERLAPGCRIYLDDAGRPDEQAIIEAWLATWPELAYLALDTERGGAVFDLVG